MLTPLSISDVEAEALLSGADGGRNELAAVAEVLAVVKAAGQADVGRDFSHLIAPVALESRATPLSRFAEEQALKRRDTASRIASRVAIAVAALFMLVVSTTGLAFAANGSKPGDWLYGLDRAAEVIGIGNGGATERFAEAQGLAAAGVPGGGLAHAAAVLEGTEENQNAVHAVNAAAVRLQEGPPGAPEEIAEKVAALLGYLHDTTIAGTVDVEKVSELAQLIGGPDGEGAPGQENDATPPGNSENAPDQEDGAPANSENPPGQSDNPPGNSENPPGPPTSTPGQGTPGGPPQP